MPDHRSHRGAHPEDAEAFAPHHHPALQSASLDLHWLLDRGYALRSALALTGDRYRLTQRQRLAVARCACRADQVRRRGAHQVAATQLQGQEVWIDGYNLLITIEAALAGGILLRGRDGCVRDMASLHGTYREVAETGQAAKLIGREFAGWGALGCRWWLDAPVGNSGRLRSILREIAAGHGWPWDVHLSPSPDRELRSSSAIVVSSDSVVLDHCERWFNGVRELLPHLPVATPVVDLSGTSARP